MQTQIVAFVEGLTHVETVSDAYNQYARDNAFNDIRKQNLLCYLEQMWDCQPNAVLVMEAPGYRGARLTGVPVTSRRLLLDGLPRFNILGASNGYQDIPEPGFERIQGEQTATIVWSTLITLGQVALIWNAFPFHPHRPGLSLTNRTPKADEIALGAPFLRILLELFRCPLTLAVGNVAAASLQQMGIQAVKVRHPAQGGKAEFVRGVSAAFAEGRRK